MEIGAKGANKPDNSVFTYFNNDDVVDASIKTVTAGAFSNGTGSLAAFYTSSAQSALSSSHYYMDVYNLATSSAGSYKQFDILYGEYAGSGYSGTYDTTYTPGKANYFQYANILLSSTQEKFEYADGGTGSGKIFVVDFKRDKIKEKLDNGNWELRLGNGTKTIHLIDSSISSSTQPSFVNWSAGNVYYIVSGSGNTQIGTTAAQPYGLAFTDLGILVLNADKVMTDLSAGTVTSSATTMKGANEGFFDLIQSGSYFAARNEETISSTTFFARLKNKQYNFSNNPSWQTGSYGAMRYSAMWRDPRVFVTTIGLYDKNNHLLAVAKLSKPVEKSFEKEVLIKCKLDW